MPTTTTTRDLPLARRLARSLAERALTDTIPAARDRSRMAAGQASGAAGGAQVGTESQDMLRQAAEASRPVEAPHDRRIDRSRPGGSRTHPGDQAQRERATPADQDSKGARPPEEPAKAPARLRRSNNPVIDRAVLAHEEFIRSNGARGRQFVWKEIAPQVKEPFTMTGANLPRADLRGMDLSGCQIRHVNFSGSRIDGLRGNRETSLQQVSLARCQGASVELGGVRAAGLSLQEARIGRLGLDDARLARTNLEGLSVEQLQADRVGLRHAIGAPTIRAGSMRDAEISASAIGGRLSKLDMSGLKLQESAFKANLDGCSLQRAHFDRTIVSGAHWRNVAADRIRIDRSVCRGMRIEASSLRHAQIGRSDFRDTAIRGSKLQSSLWENVRGEGMTLERNRMMNADIEGIRGTPKSFEKNDLFMTATLSLKQRAAEAHEVRNRMVKPKAPAPRATDIPQL